MRELEPGCRLAHFQILSLLGKGGMGVVYLAQDLRLARLVALKVLPAGLAADPALRARLVLEARATARLSHPGIAMVHEVGTDQGLDFIAMEHVQGATLRALIDAAGEKGLGASRAIEYARQTAEALASAHAGGFIHRDIKPENLMVTPDGRIKVLDFGLARRCETPSRAGLKQESASSATSAPTVAPFDPLEKARLTEAGTVAGTIAYLAPEQVRGEPLDPRADIYSLGTILFEMVTGRPPFARSSTADTLRAILRDPTPPIGPPARGAAVTELRRVIRTALSKEPASRYATASEMAADLAALQRQESRPPMSRRRRVLVAACLAGLVLASGVLFIMPRGTGARDGRTAAAPSSLRLVPLLVRPGDDEDPAVSPDGSRVVFSHRGDLFVIRVDRSGPAAEPDLLTSGEEADTEPAWSPDGGAIAFTRSRSDGGSEIWSVPSSGGPASRLVLNASSPSWSPDGSRFAFIQRALGRSTSILTVQSDGTWSRPVTRAEDAFFHYLPAWSPDGRTIAFVKDAGGGVTSDIWLVPADGGDARQLTSEPSGIFSTEPAWTPDGEWIVYASNRGGTRNIWRIPSTGGDPVRLTTGPGEDADPCVFSGGARIVYATFRAQNGLFIRDLASGAEKVLLVDSVGEPWGPDFSPDGRAVAYTRIDTSGEWNLFVVPIDGGPPLRLTSGGTASVWPRWSPDGSLIAYCTFSKEDDDLFVTPARGGGATRRLTEGGGDDWWPSWSPDGRSLVFSRTETDTTHLYRVFLSGGSPARLSDETATLPDHSPDGSFIAVARDRGYWHGVGVIPAAGGPIRWLTDTGGWPVFRPDGRAIAFIRLEPGGGQSLWEVPLEGGEPRRLEGPRFLGWNFPFDYAPDGRSIAYSNDSAVESDLWMLEMP